MSSSARFFLEKTLGEDFMESLQKFELWKPGTRTTVDHEELRTALQIVPRTIMALLIKELAPMGIGESKEIQLQVPGGAVVQVTKHERDVYTGEILQDNKRVVDFKYRSIPGLGLVIMSAFELYDASKLIEDKPIQDDASKKVQQLIDERMKLNELVYRVVDKKMAEKEAIHQMMLFKLTEELHEQKKWADHLHAEVVKTNMNIRDVTAIAKDPGNAGADEYMRGMANGLEVANSIANKKEPEFVEPPKQERKKRKLEEFLEGRKKKKEFAIQLHKGEQVDCPDCGKNIFNGSIFSGCICLGDDMDRKVFIKKTEDGIKVRFGKGWDIENIEMLLETLRRKRG